MAIESPSTQITSDDVQTQPAELDIVPHRSTRGFPAVAREFLLIVAGVVTALTAQACWEYYQERQREDDYLRQITADLRVAEAALRRASAQSAKATADAARVLRAFFAPDAAPRDSVVRWLAGTENINAPSLGLASLQALVSTGDLRILRSDTARKYVLRALAERERFDRAQQLAAEDFYAAVTSVNEKANMAEFQALVFRSIMPDSLAPFPADVRVFPFAMDIPALLRDREMYQRMAHLHQTLFLLHAFQGDTADRIRAVREKINATMK